MHRNNSRIKSTKAFGSLKLSALKVIVQLLLRLKEAKEYEEGTHAKSTPREAHTHTPTHTHIYVHVHKIHIQNIHTHTHIPIDCKTMKVKKNDVAVEVLRYHILFSCNCGSRHPRREARDSGREKLKN